MSNKTDLAEAFRLRFDAANTWTMGNTNKVEDWTSQD